MKASPAICCTNWANSLGSKPVVYLNWLPLTMIVGVPETDVRSEFGIGPFRARVVALCTQLRKRRSLMHLLTCVRSETPALLARAMICASLRPAEPSLGWSTNIASLKSKNALGENSATQPAAFAARREY